MNTAEAQDRTGKRSTALVGLALALLMALFSIGQLVAPGDSLGAMVVREAIWWGYTAVILLWLRFGERVPFNAIGIGRLTWKGLGFGVAAAVLLMLVEVLHLTVIAPLFHLDTAQFEQNRGHLAGLPVWFRLALVVRAAVFEEILYRGFLIEKVRQVTGSTPLAALVSIVTFTYAHLTGWGAVQLIPIFMAGTILALLYVWRRDLTSNMVAHFITDGVGFLAG